MDEENFGQTVSIELRPEGKETRVTDENKDEYIQVKYWELLGTIGNYWELLLTIVNYCEDHDEK